MSRLQNSWNLAKVSWRVLRSDRTLAVIPALSGLAALAALAAFAGLFFATGFDSADDSVEAMGYVVGVIAYLVLSVITVYFQAALVAGADTRLSGGDATLGASFAAANGRLPRIVPWAIVTATVSYLISALERQGWIGAIVANLLGLAWSVLTFLTIPIIVLEDAGPVRALKRSKDLFTRTWGENLVAQAGFGLVGFVAVLPAVALVAIGVASGSGVALGVTIGIGVVWLALVSVVLAALSGIYRTALYRFAVDGTAPADFAGTDLEGAFAPKERRGAFG